MLTQKIIELKGRLLEYAVLVEIMIGKSLEGLLEKNAALLQEIIDRDEQKANRYDSEIDEMCTTLIAQYEPVATDLRITLMVLKMNKDLERMADHVVNICESSLFLIDRPPLHVDHLRDITTMADTTTTMLKDSINSFVHSDVLLANSVCERDIVVDEIGDKILKELIGFMHGEKDGVKRSLHIMRIAHNLERIADLSTNICEEVVYIVEGKDIKHKKFHLQG